MLEPEKLLAAIVSSAPKGRLVGRVRLQKIIYLLQKAGLSDASRFDFSYHHYGPYSAEVDSARWFADALNIINEKRERRQSDGAAYSIFTIGEKAKDIPSLPEPYAEHVRKWAETDSIVLELAATAHWLATEEKVTDWKEEIRRRKTWKVEDGRLDKALALLKELQLPPAVEVKGHA